ncbi:MAG TPA: ATP-binding protein, partial [Candidatus Binatia bacterium]|nr:ATP-binding protein [Candidatus Binatia bacterium]
LLALNFVGNLIVAEKFLQRLFPGSKLLLAGLTEEEIPKSDFGANVSGIVQRTDPRGTIELMLRLQPELRRVVVIGGTAEIDRITLSRAQAAARTFTGRVEFDFWNDRSMTEMRRALKTLPPRTAVLLTRLYRDSVGESFIPPQAARLIAESANVPVYILGAASVGGGTVGGSVTYAAAHGKQAGEIASRILYGASSMSIPLVVRGEGVPMFDWRALKRWGINENRLPMGSIVRFRPASIWEQYGLYVAGALAIIVIQGLLIFGMLLQKTRRRRAESDLRDSQQLLDLAASANQLGLWARDPEQGEFWTNSSLRSLLGLGDNGKLRFEHVVARVHPDDRERIVSIIQNAQQKGLPFEAEFRVVLPDGNERWMAARGRSMNEPMEHGLRRIGAVFDITERKRVQHELDRQREELAHVGRVSAMGQLASALAHELNQPLGAILRNAEAAELFLRANPPDLNEVAAILADIRKDDRRAGEVIDRMRALLKRRESQWVELDWNVLVQEVARLVRHDAESRRINLALHLARSAVCVQGDRVQLQQVLLNILLNAMDAMKTTALERRWISVQTLQVNGQAEVVVRDRGGGISPVDLKRLFDPFFTTKPDGMGMGLAISQTIIQTHGGRIVAENNPDGGASFRVVLPMSHHGPAADKEEAVPAVEVV